MPLQKIETYGERSWALWRIEEDETALTSMLGGSEGVPATLRHPQKRLEWLSGRLLVKELITRLGLKYTGITKDNYGKPYPAGLNHQLSLSHSFPYVAAVVDPHESVGIDLEQPKAKLLRIGPRILDPEELHDAGTDEVKHCVYWCAKEAMVKIHGKKDLVFAENLRVTPFSLEKSGFILGRIIVDGSIATLPLWYSVEPNFVVVMNRNQLL